MDILGIRELPPPRGRPVGAVGKIRQMHHDVAQMYVNGRKPTEIAAVMHRTPATIRNWLASPMMVELLAEKEAERSAQIQTGIDRRVELSNKAATLALEKLVDLLEDPNCDLPATTLAMILRDRDDRTGLGRQETRVNLNLDVGAKLDKARERTKGLDEARAEGKVVEFVRRA